MLKLLIRDEAECGYKYYVVTVFGGNFCGACRGLDQAISFIKNAYPKKK